MSERSERRSGMWVVFPLVLPLVFPTAFLPVFSRDFSTSLISDEKSLETEKKSGVWVVDNAMVKAIAIMMSREGSERLRAIEKY